MCKCHFSNLVEGAEAILDNEGENLWQGRSCVDSEPFNHWVFVEGVTTSQKGAGVLIADRRLWHWGVRLYLDPP